MCKQGLLVEFASTSLASHALQEIRKLIISAILATDMSFHFSLTTEFKNHGGGSSPLLLLVCHCIQAVVLCSAFLLKALPHTLPLLS